MVIEMYDWVLNMGPAFDHLLEEKISKHHSGRKVEDVSISLGEQAYIAIKSMILRRELRPGDQINVAQLSEKTGLGRSPINLAIHRLEREGLVDILPRKGVLVKSETLESFMELVSARLLIEPYLTGLAVEQADAELINRLKELIQKGRECHNNNEPVGVMLVDRMFHQMLYQQAGNSILAELAQGLLDRSMRIWFQPTAAQNRSSNIEDLEELYLHIKNGDKESASSMMYKHINSLKKRMLDF
ncbi:GntR family transcriptional regulator [Alcaligenaceae bacterium]|nr:GntR family transcriptional regulator [Alcaligenaceae bacterium]